MNQVNSQETLCTILSLQIKLLKLFILKKKIAQKNKSTRRWLVRPINQKRNHAGYFVTLFQEIKQDPDMFFRVTRMNVECFNLLCARLSPYLFKRRSNIYPEERLAITLRFLATGDSIFTIALEFRIGHSTCHKIITETCSVIYERLSPAFLTIPSQQEWMKISEGFVENWHMPNCIGAIDGKHVQIKSPPNSRSLYYNYKKTYSIVLLAACDYRYNFTLFDVGAAGSESDGGILARSELGKALREQKLNIPTQTKTLPGSEIQLPYFFVGDEAFGLSSNFMRPFPGRQLEDRELIFNYRLSRARTLIERSFGILVARWQFLSSVVGMYPESVVKFVLAAVSLHNFMINLNDETRYLYCPSQSSNIQIQECHHSVRDNPLQNFHHNSASVEVLTGKKVRDDLADYFMTEKGEVPWQYEFIRRGTYRDV